MTRYLVATASAPVTEAAVDYLEPRVTTDDAVFVLTVDDGADDDRDAALARAQTGLAGIATVRTFRRTGRPDVEIVRFVREQGIDEIIMGPRRGGDFTSIGETTRSVLNKTDSPVFVVPL
jgi:nucleotide-binding universal stress UspA family protein